jgi:hypothetical protein
MPPKKNKAVAAVVEYHIGPAAVVPDNGCDCDCVNNDDDDNDCVSVSECVGLEKPPQYMRLRVQSDTCSHGASEQVQCFWCCHPIQEFYGLPIKYKNGKYATIGKFCSLECAAAFNFNSTELPHNAWESYHLLNAMSRESGIPTPIKQAPSRLALTMFGGSVSVEEFRNNVKTYTPLPVPMIRYPHIMEELHILSPERNDVVPIDNSRIQIAKQNIVTSSNLKKDTINEKMRMTMTTHEHPGAALPDTIV